MSSSFHGTSMTTSHIESHNHSNQLLEMTKSLIENFTSDSLMTQSLDPTILAGSNLNISMNSSMMSSSIQDQHPSPINNGNLYNDQSSIPIVQSSGPLVTASKMMPVPESLMSPDCGPPMIIQQRPVSTLTSSNINYTTTNARNMRYNQQQRPSTTPAMASKTSKPTKKPEKSSPSNSPRKAMANTTNTKIHQNQSILKQNVQHHQQQHSHSHPHETSTTMSSVATTEDEEDDEMNVEKLKSIRKVAKKSQKQLANNHQLVHKVAENKEVEKSAILIQKLWRGYSTRKRTVGDIAESLQQKRTQDYVLKLTKDMEMTKQALENERKIQQLQMQAINALWKKVSNMQTIPENSGANEHANNATGGLAGQDIVQDLTKTCCMLTNQVKPHVRFNRKLSSKILIS